jgi:hypothetical protein
MGLQGNDVQNISVIIMEAILNKQSYMLNIIFFKVENTIQSKLNVAELLKKKVDVCRAAPKWKYISVYFMK